MQQMIIKATTRDYVLPVRVPPPTPIDAIRQRVLPMLLKARMLPTTLLAFPLETNKIDHFEPVVHSCHEESGGFRRVPFKSPDTTACVVRQEGEERISSIKDSNRRVVAEEKSQ